MEILKLKILKKINLIMPSSSSIIIGFHKHSRKFHHSLWRTTQHSKGIFFSNSPTASKGNSYKILHILFRCDYLLDKKFKKKKCLTKYRTFEEKKNFC